MSPSFATVPRSLDSNPWAQAHAELARQGVTEADPTLESLAERALQVLITTTPAHRASLSVLDPISGLLTIAATVGTPETRVGHTVNRPRSVSEWVMRVGRGVVLQGQVHTGEIHGTARVQTSMVIPLSGERGTLGVLSLGRGAGLPAFAEADLPLAMSALIPLSLAIGRRLEAGRARQALVELESASLGPGAPWRGRPLTTPNYDCAASRHASREHGWSFATWGPSRTGLPTLMVADHFDRGVAGLVRASQLEGAFQALCIEYEDFERLVERLDRLWCTQLTGAPLSVWLAQLGPAGAVQSCAFGVRSLHLVPSGDAEIRPATIADPALGWIRNGVPHVQLHRLLPGDSLVFASDSVLDAAATADRPFGAERVTESLQEFRTRPLEDLARSLCDAALTHTGRPWWREDLLVAGLRYRREDS